MNPYLLTLTFLMLMGLLTSSQVVRFSQEHVGSQLYTHYHTTQQATEAGKAFAALEDFRAEKGEVIEEEEKKPTQPSKSSTKKRRMPALGISLERPPNNSRLNLNLWLYDGFSTNMPLDYREVLARLMRTLYQECAFYTPGLEYQLLDKLLMLKEEICDFTTPDQLATLDLANPHLQSALTHMLKGAEGRPSLLNFITFDSIGKNNHDQKKVNLLFADPLVIEALLPTVSTELIALRDTLWIEILDQEEHRLEREKDECKTRTDFKNILSAAYKEILASAGLPSKKYTFVFDATLGHLGTVLLIEDPKTGLITRRPLSQREIN